MPELSRSWVQANQKLPLKQALNLMLISGFFFCTVLFLFSFLLFSDSLLSFGFFLVLLGLLLLFTMRAPGILAGRYAREVDADLHFALRAFSLYLSIKFPFEKIITEISNSGYSCSPLFAKASKELECGKSVPQSLAHTLQYCNSISYARSVQALISIYESGGSAGALDYLCDEIVQKGISDVKAQASKSAVFGLLFVAVASLLPAFFLILNVAAGPHLGFSTSPFSIWLFYLLALPLAVCMVLAIMLAVSPSLLGTIRQKQLDSEVFSICKKSKLPLFCRLHAEPSLLSDINLAEEELAQMLLSGASSQKFCVEQMLEFGSKSQSKYLSSQCGQVLHQIKTGTSPKIALSKWAQFTPSLLFSRSISLLLVGYETGASIHKSLEAAASDLLSSFNLVRERAALLSLQNYTLIGASAILVPAILSISLSFSSQISELSSAGAFGGFSPQDSVPLISAASFAIPVYLIINSFLCAFFVSTTSGARHKFLGYALGLSMLSLLVWSFLPILG